MKIIKKSLLVFLALIMVISIIPMSSITAGAEELATSGTCGENLTCTFDEETGKLTISGTGEMISFYDSENGVFIERPWEEYRDNISTIVIEDGVTTIGDYAFSDCINLNSVIIGNSVTAIGDYAFYACDSLMSIVIGNNVTIIGDYAFCWCCKLTSVTIPDNVTTIGSRAFSYCGNLASTTIGNSVTTIGNYAFALCGNLTNIIIPNNVETIGHSAFEGCTSLTSVVLGNGITKIGFCFFSGCTSLASVTISNNVTSVEQAAFARCNALVDVYYSGTEEQWNAISIDNYENYNDTLLDATIHYNYHTHDYESVTIIPTCTEQGYTTYTCDCGDNYIDNYVNATGHADNDGDGYCDSDNEPLDPTVECGCNCHKSGISNFFFKFILFFQRLFGSNKECACGVAHY